MTKTPKQKAVSELDLVLVLFPIGLILLSLYYVVVEFSLGEFR